MRSKQKGGGMMTHYGKIFAMEIMPDRRAKVSFDIVINEHEIDEFKKHFCDNKEFSMELD